MLRREEKKVGGHCSSRTITGFDRSETILLIGAHADQVGVILEGNAHISSFDREGRENIMEFLREGDCFGAYLLQQSESMEYIVIADDYCKVMFVNFENVLHNCRNNCENHAELVKSLLLLTAGRAQSLSEHVHILSQRTLRDKLLAYLESQRRTSKDGVIRIPMTLAKLADYIGVDRSAMMREIQNMNRLELIRSKGRDFKLL